MIGLFRDDMHLIKSGEEDKRKFYRALCVLIDKNVTVDIIEKLNVQKAFEIQQWTPLRVLHRRTLMKRPRTVFSIKGFAIKGGLLKLNARDQN
jgi:tRNA pseudouridine synthase 10